MQRQSLFCYCPECNCRKTTIINHLTTITLSTLLIIKAGNIQHTACMPRSDRMRLISNITPNTYFDCIFFLQKFFRKKPVRDLLPGKPIEEVSVEPWWKVHVGYITEDDIKVRNPFPCYHSPTPPPSPVECHFSDFQ